MVPANYINEHTYADGLFLNSSICIFKRPPHWLTIIYL